MKDSPLCVPSAGPPREPSCSLPSAFCPLFPLCILSLSLSSPSSLSVSPLVLSLKRGVMKHVAHQIIFIKRIVTQHPWTPEACDQSHIHLPLVLVCDTSQSCTGRSQPQASQLPEVQTALTLLQSPLLLPCGSLEKTMENCLKRSNE